ncbi:hypothetical protein LXA43DRAFT_1067438 [Ganoderma leucocontextum]|nr:hypothetical protein LXA43DRAFT_1067438 [Ganoderma leucocontextum]
MDPSDAAAAELTAEYNSIFIDNYCANAAAVVFIYEYFTTISEEAKYFWNRKLTGASALFFLNRYVPLLGYTLSFAGYASMSDQYIFWAGGGPASHRKCVVLIPDKAFAGSRAFALTRRNWIMLLLVCGLSLVPVVVNLVPVHYGVTGENVPLIGCIADDFTPLDVGKR